MFSLQVAIRAELGKLDTKVTKLTLLGFSCVIKFYPLHHDCDLTKVGLRKLMKISIFPTVLHGMLGCVADVAGKNSKMQG